MRRSRILATAAAVALAAASVASTGTAEATAPPTKTLASGLLSPLTAAIAADGTAYVTQNFGGLLTRIAPGKKPKTVYASTGGDEVGGVSERNGVVVFTETADDDQGEPADSWVKRISRSGKVTTIAHVRAYEDEANPDGVITYGARGISDECAADWPTDSAGPAVYTGAVDSHPYATYQTKRKVYVADAGMNAVLAIGPGGAISTVAVTPAVPVAITQDVATSMGLPDCAVGLTYYGESVPTDVELGPDGKLYVTTEGGGLGEKAPLGSLYRIDPASGKVTRVASGLFAPVGVAVSPQGDLFVSQLFGNEISRIKHGTSKVKTFAGVTLPAAVEISDGHLYATTQVLPPDQGAPAGKLVRFKG